MLRPLASHLARPQRAVSLASALSRSSTTTCVSRTPPTTAAAPTAAARPFSSVPAESSSADESSATTKHKEEMHYFHFNRREKPKPKFKSPRKRASKLLAELNDEAVARSKEGNPDVWSANVRVGDAIEITSVNQGGVDSADVEKLRGVVLGKTHRGLATSVIIRDVVMGTPIERKVCLHSPLIKSVKVLEENFVYKGKRKVKRAKLYFMRDRKPEDTRVSKW